MTVKLTRSNFFERPEQPQQTGGATGGIEADSSIKAFVEQKMAIQDQKIATFESIAAVLNSEILKCLNKTDECMNKINTTNTQVKTTSCLVVSTRGVTSTNNSGRLLTDKNSTRHRALATFSIHHNRKRHPIWRLP